jgi:hypothetical protein
MVFSTADRLLYFADGTNTLFSWDPRNPNASPIRRASLDSPDLFNASVEDLAYDSQGDRVVAVLSGTSLININLPSLQVASFRSSTSGLVFLGRRRDRRGAGGRPSRAAVDSTGGWSPPVGTMSTHIADDGVTWVSGDGGSCLRIRSMPADVDDSDNLVVADNHLSQIRCPLAGFYQVIQSIAIGAPILDIDVVVLAPDTDTTGSPTPRTIALENANARQEDTDADGSGTSAIRTPRIFPIEISSRTLGASGGSSRSHTVDPSHDRGSGGFRRQHNGVGERGLDIGIRRRTTPRRELPGLQQGDLRPDLHRAACLSQ